MLAPEAQVVELSEPTSNKGTTEVGRLAPAEEVAGSLVWERSVRDTQVERRTLFTI
jgi:hypothetical protein